MALQINCHQGRHWKIVKRFSHPVPVFAAVKDLRVINRGCLVRATQRFQVFVDFLGVGGSDQKRILRLLELVSAEGNPPC